MNDRQDPYGHIYGYDEYGRPLYRTAQDQPLPQDSSGYPAGQTYDPDPYAASQPGGGQAYDPYAPYSGQGYGQDPYAAQPEQQQPGYGYPGPQQPVSYGTAQQPAVDDYGYDPTPQGPQARGASDTFDAFGTYGPGPQAPVRTEQPPAEPSFPQQQPSQQPWQQPPSQRQPEPGPGVVPPPRRPEEPRRPAGPGVPGGHGPDDDGYHTEQFAFVEEQEEESEDVIDWLKFTESRTERREEAKRKGRSRQRLLVIALVLALLGAVGGLWYTGNLPGVPGPGGSAEESAAEAERRDVIVVHLRETNGDVTSTALLVANETTGHGTVLLLPNNLAVSPDGGSTTLGQAVTEEGAASVREAVGLLLGADIKGTWRLDTPYLENLVDLAGGITLDSDTEVPGEDGDEPLVPAGEGIAMDGRAAVAYAVHRGGDEPQEAQLERFGQVMEAVLRKLPTTDEAATRVVENLAQIADPSLPEDELGVSLAQLAALAKEDKHTTVLLPVEDTGMISDETATGLVAEVLGGTVSNAEGGVARIGVRDATGTDDAVESARAALINGGFSVVDTRAVDDTRAETEVRYADEAHRETAMEVAILLGLGEQAVVEEETSGNADVTILLGEDYGD
ncbi:LytR C-terminal domain-containing protein [Streptomyces sp. ACA25]|uniref:LCP family protein n=1 Tax=Streptomyces sp. ACA25 TaxID=3022596 RepID=UPI002307E5D3|nr:LytR C-terminal domain-containing protein [Streptomyces sp. ACA25]MDB1088188.1 LytR C-terminal domain-containing protein [Streptomyces sp. ACA25]